MGEKFNAARNVSRRRKVKLWRNIVGDTRALPPVHADAKEDEKLFEETDPFVDGSISVDHGLKFKVGKGSFLNFGRYLDRMSLSTERLSLWIQRYMKGSEAGKEVHIEDDAWIGGSVLVLAGVRIGKGCTIGAGSVVTKEVPPFHFAAGNPARVIRRIETQGDIGP